ncbi:MAG: Hpt domain-containing protein, partial [Spirochaetota bacterium]|nr:Hpt domain-containing protein [Spirochaetota bacterium]
MFRAAHTLKGGSSTLDLDRIANFTHEMENLLEEVRSGNIKLNPDLVDLLLKSIDIVKKLIITSQEGKEQPPGFEDSIIEAIKQASKALDVPPTQVSSQSPITKPSSEQFKNKIDFVLNEYERYLIKKAPLEGYKVYEVYVKFNDSNPMRTVSGLQIHSQLKEISDVLKSIPDIDDLMSDYFQEEAIFITQSTSSSTEIYNKVFISDVTDFIEVNEFTEEVEEETSESLGGALNLTPEDLQEIQNHILAGKKVYKILITFDESNPMRSVSGVLFFTMLRTKGEILKCVPSYEDFKKDTFYPNGEFIFASTHSSKDLRNKLYLSDVTKELKFQEFQKENGKQTDFKIKQEEIKKTEVIPEKIFEPEKAKQKELVTPKTIDDTLKVAPVSKQSVSATMDEGADSSVERKQIASVLRVESSRIDEMLNLVGELVIIKASFMQINEKNSFILDELSSTFNQYKQNTRVLMGEVEEFIENYALQANHSSTSKTMSSNDLDSDGKYDLDKSKEYFASRFESLFGFFDSVIPQYKSMQEKLKNSSQHLGRITDDLQESVMKVRMVPINQIFSRFPRLIRDISKNLNKKINLDMQGEETELDKSVIEDLVDPLVHIVRNAVDHGIESPKERADLGKDPTGNVLLKAEHEGNTVTITVKDDGRGINLDKVRKKAIESRLIDSNQEVSKEELI